MPDLIGHLLRGRGRELGPSGHEVAGAPDGVPPLSPTMSLTPSRTPHPSQLDPSPFAAPSPQLAPFASRTSRHAYSLLPAPSIVHPPPLPSPSPPARPHSGHDSPSFRARPGVASVPKSGTEVSKYRQKQSLRSTFWDVGNSLLFFCIFAADKGVLAPCRGSLKREAGESPELCPQL